MFWRKRKFKEIAKTVLKLKQLKSRKTIIAANYEINRLTEYFGEMKIDEITEERWAEYVISEKQKKARKFFDDRKYMRMILLYAFRQGLTTRKVTLEIPDGPSKAGRELSQDEIDKLLQHAGEQLRFQIQIAYKMGLRLREMLHLRWDQFDWKEMTIELLASDTKTRRGRLVPISPDLVFDFQKRRSEATSRFVFPSPGNPNKPQFDNKTAWVTCKAAAGIEARWHDLRHTCVSRMRRGGAYDEAVCATVGMSKDVLPRYSHWNLADLRAAVEVTSTQQKLRPPPK